MRYRPKLSEAEVVSFEKRAGISLPTEYREFLLQCGDGTVDVTRAWWFGGTRILRLYGISSLSEWCQPQDEEDVNMSILREEFDSSAPLGRLISGAVRIGNIGCESYELLVVSGPHAGEMWRDGRIEGRGVRPLRHDGHTMTFRDWHRSVVRYGDRHPLINAPKEEKNQPDDGTDNSGTLPLRV